VITTEGRGRWAPLPYAAEPLLTVGPDDAAVALEAALPRRAAGFVREGSRRR